MNILLVVVPRYGAYTMVLTGSLMLLTNFLYWIMVPSQPLIIRFEDSIVNFSFGWCYWVVLIGGKKSLYYYFLSFFVLYWTAAVSAHWRSRE